jgi:hypothetical protein
LSFKVCWTALFLDIEVLTGPSISPALAVRDILLAIFVFTAVSTVSELIVDMLSSAAFLDRNVVGFSSLFSWLEYSSLGRMVLFL